MKNDNAYTLISLVYVTFKTAKPIWGSEERSLKCLR